MKRVWGVILLKGEEIILLMLSFLSLSHSHSALSLSHFFTIKLERNETKRGDQGKIDSFCLLFLLLLASILCLLRKRTSSCSKNTRMENVERRDSNHAIVSSSILPLCTAALLDESTRREKFSLHYTAVSE